MNDHGYLKAYKVQCRCGKIFEYKNVSAIKAGTSTQCISCALRDQTNRNGISSYNEVLKYFYDKYGTIIGNKLWSIYGKRHEKQITPYFPNGIPFDENWKTDYIDFANHIVSLENFDKYPEFTTNRIDNHLGYIKDNIEFVSKVDNSNNRDVTRFIEFNGIKYPFADFIRLITGSNTQKEISAPYKFVALRYYVKKFTVNQALRALYDEHKIWESKETENYYCRWYEKHFQAKPRKAITDI